MSQRDWQRLPQEEASIVMRTIGDAADSAVFSVQMTEVTCKPLPFYNKFKLYRLINYATMPCFKMDYLGDGDAGHFFPLDGLANTLYDVNDNDAIELSRDTVTSYLDFFFAQVQGPEGDIYLIKSANALPMLNSLPENQQDKIREHFQNIQIRETDEQDGFLVHASLYYGGTLLSADIHVKKSGQISVQNQKLMLRGIHFPSAPVDYTYMDDQT
jgi:hypothetical protein